MAPIDLTRAHAIDGWMSDEELIWLGEQAQHRDRMIEVGCYLGHSTVVLAEHIRCQMYAVDPWPASWKHEVSDGNHPFLDAHPDPYSEFVKNTDDFFRSGKLSIYRGDLQTCPIGAVDWVFIDGSHLYSAVMSDIMEAFLRLKGGGLLSGHDYDYPSWPHVKLVVDRLFGSRVCNPAGHIWSVQF